MVSAVVVDNGERTLAECVASIRKQRGVDEVIIAAGPKTDTEVAKQVADDVVGPFNQIGYARYIGLARSSSDIVMLADSDTIYACGYLGYALELIDRYPLVKAGTVYPLDQRNPLWVVDHLLFKLVGAYEFGWVARKRELVSAINRDGVHRLLAPRADFGWLPSVLKMPYTVSYRMTCYTRLPTHFTKMYAVPAMGAIAVASAIPAVVALAEVEKALRFLHLRH